MSEVFLINVGRERNAYLGPKLNSVETVLSVLELQGIKVLEHVSLESDSEPTVVARVVAPGQYIYEAASRLNQDCIAAWSVDNQYGVLVGPGANKWGEFDPHQFFCLDGARLDEHLGVEGEA